MCKFGLEENNRIRHSVRMYGHLDDCFIRISKILPQYTPEQIENHYNKYLDEEAPPINYERILETYEKLQAINIKNERLRKLVFICQEFYSSLKKSVEQKIHIYI
ncbi:hypothetical protein RhiirA5_416114 [Rhizophagus irregularis]|uniref:Myb-like domain-containing protein n=1 Tax=Rhizophagus irregularis TaxID=588596 RepID=A0A2I1E728_9GLOM|nr:hypothetical protein RhiirA5_416114 [Rhizophagus irregularis]PKY17909.1 hypothetical protein RhiirB3_430626 [Rhizophagus irregularis]CAB5111249.1 unnamed protein product [Rhizophagus irregularis]CAB5356278.1 unnamed protein product [Rhizophagus irregularis]